MSKSFKLYSNSSDRVKEAFHPLRKKFHEDFFALKDVSFNVSKGETFGILGKNGSGKSTLLQIICGILQPTSGSISTTGRISALLELGAGFNPEFTGIENVYLNGSILGLSTAEIDNRLDRILAFADIGDFVNQPVKTYSSGMFVRLAFAVMANIDPEIFVVDEALAVGDAYFVHRCMNRFRELQDQGTTILFVTHDIGSIKRFCSRALWLHEGKVKALGSAVETADSYIEYLFGLENRVKNIETNTDNETHINDNQQTKTDKVISSCIFPSEETKIPNIDKRLGNGQMICTGVGIYDLNGNQITEINHGSQIYLRATYQNISIDRDDYTWSAGYVCRDFKGLDIASFASKEKKTSLPPLKKNEKITISFLIHIPLLYPGSYSFSPSISLFQDDSMTYVLCDRITNAIALQITSTSEMHVMMKFPTEISFESLR